MSNPFRDAMEALINEKVGTSSSRTIQGVVTYIHVALTGERDWCTVCPIDLDIIWDVKSYYRKTAIDRNSAQGVIERVRLASPSGLIIEELTEGDQVVVAYKEDRPYILQRIAQADGMNIQQRAFSIAGTDTTTYQWLGEAAYGAFSDLNDSNPLPYMSAMGDDL